MTGTKKHGGEKKYDAFASSYDQWDAEHRSIARQRRQLVRRLSGKVLEVGVGTGLNLEFYPPRADVTAIDVSRDMLEAAVHRLNGTRDHRVKLLRSNAERTPFIDDTFDVVVGTFVFCSFDHPKRAAVEIKRVLRPRGRFVTLGYHTEMVARLLRRAGLRVRSIREWDTDEERIGRIIAEKAA